MTSSGTCDCYLLPGLHVLHLNDREKGRLRLKQAKNKRNGHDHNSCLFLCAFCYTYDIFIDLAQTKWQSLTKKEKTLKSCSLCLSRATTSWLPQRPRRLNYEKLKWSSGLPWIFSSTQNYSSKRALSFVTIVKWISFWLKLNKNTLSFVAP